MVWRGLPIPTAVATAYLQLERAARWLGLSLPATFTPHERAEQLSAALPPVRPGVEAITEQYVVEQYSPHPADGDAAQSAWRGIRLNVWRRGVQNFLARLGAADWGRASSQRRREP
jgi:hypothetical protein